MNRCLEDCFIHCCSYISTFGRDSSNYFRSIFCFINKTATPINKFLFTEETITIKDQEKEKKVKALEDLDKIYESGVLIASPKLTSLCDKDNRILSKVHPGMVVKSETGHIALVGSSDYTVVLTPNKEIQLNQTCNFPFEYHATIEESEELFEQLKMQKALEVSSTGTLINWSPNDNDSYDVINSLWNIISFVSTDSEPDKMLREAGNMFPVGFITEEKQKQLKETLKNLFDSWRK